jgi:hypothetical protein
MTYNRNLSCEACRPPVRDAPGTSDSSAVSGVLQMHDEMSAMSWFAAVQNVFARSKDVRGRPRTSVAVRWQQRGLELVRNAGSFVLVPSRVDWHTACSVLLSAARPEHLLVQNRRSIRAHRHANRRQFSHSVTFNPNQTR